MSYDWNRGLLLQLGRRVVDVEMTKMYDWIVVGWMYIPTSRALGYMICP